MKNSLNLKLSSALLIILAALPFFAFSQFSKPEEKFPAEERYLYPIQPGQPGSLAGTMGELRSNHFHSGIDIRTDNMVGWAVQASKSGYISRISVSGSGYGNVMYVTHPDGNTTLYAHLDKFPGPWGEYVLKEHYRRKSNDLDLNFPEDRFPVRQGDTIAWSGNTGSTNGPHLHFDIRDAQNYALDPLIVGRFPELVDRLPPAAEKIALRTLDINARINDQFGRFEFYVRRIGNEYELPAPIFARGRIGVEIIAKDKLAPQSQFYGGVNYFEMRVDTQLIFKQAIERVNVEETRAIYTLMDYKTMRNKGTRFYKLYVEDGNDLAFYKESPGSGKIQVDTTRETTVQIKMSDSNSNTSTVTFRLSPSAPVTAVRSLEAYPYLEPTFDISENTMTLNAKPCENSGNKATLYAQGTVREITPAYYSDRQSVYLLDLREVIPDSVSLCGASVIPHIRARIPSGTEYTYYGDLLDVQFPLGSLYDTLYLTTDYSRSINGRELFTLGSRNVPLHKSIRVSLKPAEIYARDGSIAVYRVAGNNYTYIGGEWLNGRIHFMTREFGDFTILKDSIAPLITPLSVSSRSARFRIKDELSGIRTYEARINDEWLLLSYDQKSNTIQTQPFNATTPLKGKLEIVVTDNAGNTSRYTKTIP